MHQTNPNVGFYAQDEWKAGSRLTLNLGLRYDLQLLETIDTDTNNVSPRLGFAWSPFDSRNTIVRGSAGLFFDRVPLRALANALLSAGNTTDLDASSSRPTSACRRPRRARRCFPSILAGPVPLGHARQPDDDGSESAERLFAPGAASRSSGRSASSARSASATSTCAASDLIMSINQNVPTCVASGTNNGCRPNPAYANNSQYSSAGDSNYHGLHVSFIQRPTRVGLLSRQLHAVEVDEQCRRVLLQLADRSVRSVEGLGPVG